MTDRHPKPVTPFDVEGSRDALRRQLGERRPRVALVLGSGLTADRLGIVDPLEIPVESIPHVARPSIAGHGQSWIAGTLEGVEVIVAAGRVHLYEGLPLDRVTLGVRVLAAIGCESLVVTNAAGGIRADLVPGTLMRISDHLNMIGDSPLRGAHHPEFGDRFVDMTDVYDAEWGERVEGWAKQGGIALHSGVYAACLGPQYETPAEIRFLRAAGADAVGMSTVPEVIVARQCGLRVFGLSLISNAAAGVTGETLSHEEVMEAGRQAGDAIARLIREVVRLSSSTDG